MVDTLAKVANKAFNDSTKVYPKRKKTLYTFLNKGTNVDTSIFDGTYYYCKIGKFLINGEKSALLIYGDNVVLYSYDKNTPVKIDSLSGLDFRSAFSFNPKYKDYNFDGQKDIYINLTCSNGLPLCYGYLLLVNKDTKRLERHKECEVLANMVPDPRSKIVFSDTLLECGTGGPEDQLHQLTNKWINGKLVTQKTNCHCK